MTDDHEIADAEPFSVSRYTTDDGVERVQFEITMYPAPGSDSPESPLPHRRWSIDYPTEHVHPRQSEYWKVRSGELRVAVDGAEHTLTAGEETTLPADVPHRVWNPTDRPNRVAFEFRPSMQSASLTETLYALGQAGEMDEAGNLKLLQFAVLLAAYPDHLYLTAVPVRAQKLLARLLAPIGRRAGYRATWTVDSIDDSAAD